MNGKRQVLTKSTNCKYNGKLKDMFSPNRYKTEQYSFSLSNVPLIRQSDSTTLLPKYTAVLNRSAEYGVNMDDLDQLQQDLEQLLCTSVCRHRFLLREPIDRVEENRDKKEKNYDKTPIKRKRPDDKTKYKDLKTGSRLIKKQYGLSANNLPDGYMRHPKVSRPKNENSDKFWTSIEPYCTNVSRDDVAFLDSLIEEFSKEIEIKIPDIGDHYAHEWSEELLNDEQNLGKSPKSKTTQNVDVKKNGLSALVDTFSTPHAQKLLAALIEERVILSFPNMDKLKSSDLNLKSSGPRVGVCMDKKLEQGILNLEDIPKCTAEDEILTEIRKCQDELKTINDYNLEELIKLKGVVQNDLQKQQVKDELEKIDKQVLDLYHKVLIAKKQVQQIDGDEFDKSVLTQNITNDFENQADILLKQQIILHTQAYPECNLSHSNDQYFADIH